MTEQQTIERIAEWMGWKELIWQDFDWNAWRQVEEKLMEDEELWKRYMIRFSKSITTYMQATLSKRIDVLLSALDK